VWVNTIGTRPVRLDTETAHRVIEKCRHWKGGSRRPPSTPRGTADNPLVLNPVMWPSFGSRLGRCLNRLSIIRALHKATSTFSTPPIVLTTLPITAGLIGHVEASKWVYYCVDDFTVWPGYDGATMRAMERDLLAGVDEVIAVSESLVERIGRLGRDASLLTHGIDLGRWSQRSCATVPDELFGLEQPFVVFWGVIDRRMNVDWLARLSARMTRGSIVLFGPTAAPLPSLARIPRVRMRPAVPYAHLPRIAASASVLIMPYADLPVTRAMQPLKLKEYLATSKPVVVSRLPATVPWADACDVADSADAFSEAVVRRLDCQPSPGQLAARERLHDESWHAKAAALREVITTSRPD